MMFRKLYKPVETLPSSVEAYLRDAGFSGTELLVLKRLLEEDALTLRQLAAKTGKSTGVLDQAMKKLLKKRIVNKEIINETPKYTLHSLRSIVQWMEKDMKEKQQMLLRRHQNFETFISSLDVSKGRPDLEHFEGEEGIVQAYERLLSTGGGKEFLHYFPVTHREEDDPLRDFRVQFFRVRRARNIFARYLTYDNPLGRRFQSRDPFEYRASVLIPVEDYPFSFEKVIAETTIACIDHEKRTACLIRFPELAEVERGIFETFWRNRKDQKVKNETQTNEVASDAAPVPEIPIKTRTISQLRAFLVSPQSIVVFGILALLSAGVTFGLYRANQTINFQRMQDKVSAIATTGALQIDVRDLDQLHSKEDYQKPEWKRVNLILKEIQSSNTNIMYVYIFRKSARDSQKLEFVADQLFIDPFANVDSNPKNDVDMNGDGAIDGGPAGGDYLAWPGQTYPDPPQEAFDSFQGTKASHTFYEDQWGKVMTGYAPIRGTDGTIAAMLAVDMKSTMLSELTNRTFVPLCYFIGFFLLFIVVRLAAFNRSLLKEIQKLMNLRRLQGIMDLSSSRLILQNLLLCGLAAIVITLGLYKYTLHIMKQEIGTRLMSIATTAATQINPSDLKSLRFARDMRREEYQKVFGQLNEIRNRNPDVKYAYIFRPTEDPEIWEFVADADSNHFIPFLEKDHNFDGVLDDADENLHPGVRYDISFSSPTIAAEGLILPTYERKFVNDQWGKFVTGSAPILSDGKAVAVLGLDMDVKHFFDISVGRIKLPIYIFVAYTFCVLLLLLFRKTKN